MARDVKFGTVTTGNGNIPADEPVFVLRAQDVLALIILRDYAERAGRAGCAEPFLRDVQNAIAQFEVCSGDRKRPE